MTQGIYKIKNTNNDKIYIGSSKNIENRFKAHISNLKNNNHHSIKLQRSYNKTKDKSIFKLSIIEEVDNIESLKEREQHYINEYDSFNNGYNCYGEVDNVYYTIKNKKIKDRKALKIQCYDKFINIFDTYEDSIEIGSVFLDRLRNKHYSAAVYKDLIGMVEWFLDHYDTDNHILRIDVCMNRKYFMTIKDKKINYAFVCYKWEKNKIHNSKCDTDAYRRYFVEYAELDIRKHYIVDDLNSNKERNKK